MREEKRRQGGRIYAIALIRAAEGDSNMREALKKNQKRKRKYLSFSRW